VPFLRSRRPLRRIASFAALALSAIAADYALGVRSTVAYRPSIGVTAICYTSQPPGITYQRHESWAYARRERPMTHAEIDSFEAKSAPAFFLSNAWPQADRRFLISEVEIGWPLRSFEGERLYLARDASAWTTYGPKRTAFGVRTPRGSMRLFPSGPRPKPLIANMAVNGALIFIAWTLLSRLALATCGVFPRQIRKRRHSRGQCVRCAYQLAGLATCPECGRTVYEIELVSSR